MRGLGIASNRAQHILMIVLNDLSMQCKFVVEMDLNSRHRQLAQPHNIPKSRRSMAGERMNNLKFYNDQIKFIYHVYYNGCVRWQRPELF